MNRLYTFRQQLQEKKDFIDLVETNFHRAGFCFPFEPLKHASAEYFDTASYDPDPQGSVVSRDAIANYHLSRGHQVSAKSIVITASTSESYGLVFSGLFGREDTVLLPTPSYPLFEEVALHHGVPCEFYPMHRGPAGWYIEQEEVAKIIGETRPRAVVLISPNNPTGMVADQQTANALAAATAELGQDHYLLIDEVFCEFADVPVPSPKNTSCPVLYLNGASKTFASPDLKIAWIAVQPAHDEAVVERLSTVNDTYLNSSSLSQYLVPTLFEHLSWCRRHIASPLASRRAVVKRLMDDHPELGISTPQGGIHATLSPIAGRSPLTAGPAGSGQNGSFRRDRHAQASGAAPRVDAPRRGTTAPMDDEELVLAILEHTHVFLHPGYLYGWDQDVVLVTSYLGDEATTAEALKRVAAFLRSLET